MYRNLLARLGLGILFLLAMSGCAPQGLFYWGDYETSLHDRYVANDAEHPEGRLRNTLLEAENQNRRVPPGVNADYGFMLYKRGDKAGAIAYFDKERQLYPESSALMNKLIERVNLQAKPKEVEGAAAPKVVVEEKQ